MQPLASMQLQAAPVLRLRFNPFAANASQSCQLCGYYLKDLSITDGSNVDELTENVTERRQSEAGSGVES